LDDFAVDDEVIKDMVAMGLPSDAIESAKRSMSQQEEFELMEDNVLPVTVFQAMRTQWRIASAGDKVHRVGLDYAPLPFVMRSCGVKPGDRKQIFADVHLMELEALKVFSERNQ
jgi:hypothetical protein